MPKQEKTATTKQPKFYQKALFPWAIIVLAATLFSGMALGWTLRSDQAASIKAEVASQVAETVSLKDLSQK